MLAELLWTKLGLFSTDPGISSAAFLAQALAERLTILSDLRFKKACPRQHGLVYMLYSTYMLSAACDGHGPLTKPPLGLSCT